MSDKRPSGSSWSLAAAAWLHACTVAGVLATLEYLSVPVLTWLRDRVTRG
jgi:hypothetical protein